MPAGRVSLGERPGRLCFCVVPSGGAIAQGIETATLEPMGPGWSLRVDEVAFPVGAVAHRHVHTGQGWRWLLSGSLRIETDHGTQVMEPGDAWFEAANSPVRAVALQDAGITRFVRCMAVPAEDFGRSTFRLCDPADASLPRLQITHRLLEHVVQVDAG